VLFNLFINISLLYSNNKIETFIYYRVYTIIRDKKGEKMSLLELIDEEKPTKAAVTEAEKQAFEDYYS
jgi:hypothetical protein